MLTIRRFLFPQRNQIFVALTALLIPMVFLVIKYCDAPLIFPEKWFGFLLCDPEGDKTWYNIAIGYVSAYFFYIIQVYLPTAHAEKRAWLNIQPKLSVRVREWKEYTILLRTLLEFEENGNVLPLEKDYHYYRLCTDDNRPSSLKRKTPEQKPLRTPDACIGTDGLIKKAKEFGERSQKFMDLQVMGKLDVNLWRLLCDTDPVSFFQGASRDLNAIKHIFELRQKLSEAQAEEKKKRILESFVLPDGITIKREGQKLFICAWTGEKREIAVSGCENIPLHTMLPDSLSRMEQNIAQLERYCDLNCQVAITEMTKEERAQIEANNAIYHPAIRAAMGS